MTDVDDRGRHVVVEQTARLLDFLAALARDVGTAPVRDITRYDHVLWPDAVPEHGAVRVGPAGESPAWLSVSRVPAPMPPDPPASLQELIDSKSLVDPNGTPRLRADSTSDRRLAETEEPPQPTSDQGSADGSDRAEHLLSEQVSSEHLLAEWTTTTWQPWAERAKPAIEARRLYDELYALHLRAERDQATHEVVWGRAVLSWFPAQNARICAPILTVPVTIDIDAQTGTITVAPERAMELELETLEGLNLPGVEELASLRSRLRDTPPDPWAPAVMDEVRRSFIAPLGLNATLVPGTEVPPPGPHPVVNDGWVLFLRPRPVRHERFYTELSRVLTDTQFLPEALAAIVADDQQVAGAVTALGQAGPAEASTPVRLLMPLPTNPEQERIARQLATARGVTVQGPPGTGKSHTIANLVSHLVAEGKRVLVTAQNEQALSVLREKIPADLRDLAVAVLGSTPAAMDQVRASVQTVMDSVSGIDPDREERRIAEMARNIDEARERLRRNDLDLVEALRSEEREFPLPTGPAKAPSVALWLTQNERLGLIPDPLTERTALPLTVDELSEFFTLAATIDPDDATAALQDLPTGVDLPGAGALIEQHSRLDRLRDTLADLEVSGLRVHALDNRTTDELADLASRVRSAAQRLDAISGEWETHVGRELTRSAGFVEHWTTQLDELRADIDVCMELRRRLTGHDVTVPDGDHRTQLKTLDELAARFTAGKGVPRLLGSKDLRALHATVRVDGLELRTVEEVRLAQAAIDLRVAERKLATRFTQLADGTPIPVPPLGPGFLAAAEEFAAQLARVCQWYLTDAPALSSELSPVITAPDPVASPVALRSAADTLEHARARFEEQQLTAHLAELARTLDQRASTPGASPLWADLGTHLSTRDFAGWRAALEEAARLTELRPHVLRRAELETRLSAAAPLWTRAILEHRGDPAVVGHPADAPAMWRWRQARTWLAGLHAGPRPDALMAQALELTAALERQVLEMAARSARLALRTNLKDRQRRALSAWLNALGRRGKGTGKYAAYWEAEARRQLPDAMGAIPVWIMPIHRVIENFDPTRSELFDVVIVDESSQCDLLSAGVLALGRKAVVVGDDKQTSPAAVGVDRTRVRELQEIHIPDVDQRQLLTLDESLYSIAERAFPSVIMLREHFRCVPEIIEFSNRYYDGAIRPLREQTHPQIGAPLRAVRVQGAAVRTNNHTVNRLEAQALVDQVVQCSADPAYDGLTFGVVVLQSGPQAQIIESMLMDRLGIEEFQRRRLRVGNAANFQGDERHVMFISVVADSASYAAVRTPDKQRINVAASRAQDQLWVFHSVDPSTLHPDDERRALIEYASTPRLQRHTDLFELAESGFERDVMSDILHRGYRVDPQYRVGAYRIDLVVHAADGERLAVECDGDKFHGAEQWDNDIRRQRVLERLGWSFWRVRASAYYLDRQAAMAPLWERLQTMRARAEAAAARKAQQAERAALERARRAAESTSYPVVDSHNGHRAEHFNGEDADPDLATVDWQEDHRHTSPADQATPAQIRDWARRHGYDVASRGRLRPEIIEAYRRVHPD